MFLKLRNTFSSTTYYLALISLLIFSSVDDANGQDVIPTKGKEFWIGFMQNFEVDPGNESLDLFITSDLNTTGTVTIPLQGWSQDFVVVANQTSTVTIPNNIAENLQAQGLDNKGVFVETLDTVSVFAINFAGYTADASKILPVQSLGTEYRVSSYEGLSSYDTEFLIVATQDDTEVEITPSSLTAGGNAAGVPFTITMDAGETYQVQGNGGDLTGSTIIATEESGPCRPFAVFSGTVCVNVPIGCGYCDHICEQNFPVGTWGTDFYVVPFNFATSYTYRVLANEDNTQVSINGGAPLALDAGDFLEYNDVSNAQCVDSNLPISVTQYMEGVACADAGDPAMLILNDASQKIDNITFSTVESDVITQHGLNIVMESNDVGSLTLDGGSVDVNDFVEFPSCPELSYAQISITEGSHTLDSQFGFTAYVYGTGDAESYAYSAGSFNPAEPLQVDSVVCTSDTVTLVSGIDLFDVIWYLQSNPDSILEEGNSLVLTPPIIPGIYVALGNQYISGCEDESLFLVEVPESPIVEALPPYSEICQYESVQLNMNVTPMSDVYTYSWSPIAGLDNPNIPNPIATPLESTTYTLTISSLSGCATAQAELQVDVIAGNISGITAESDDYMFCTGEDAQFSADVEEIDFVDNFDPGVSWGLWCEITNGVASNDCGSVSGNALYFNGAGDRLAATEAIDASAGGTLHFSLKIGSGAFPCDNADPGENVVLEYSTNGCAGPWEVISTFYESSYSEFTNLNIPIPAAAETAQSHFRWRQLANSGNNQDNWALEDVYIGISNPGDFDFLWTPDYNLDDNGISNPVASPMEDTVYYVEVVDANTGCTYIDSVEVDVGQGFTLETIPDTILCDIQGIDLWVTPSGDDEYDYEWGPNDGTISGLFSDSPTVSPIATTAYTVNVISDQGCEASAEVNVTVNQLLDLTVSTDNNDFCQGEIANLSATVGGNPPNLEYSWIPVSYLDDPFSSNPVCTPTGPVLYTVTVTDTLSNCSLSDEIELEVVTAFTVTSIEDTLVCSSMGLELLAETSSTDNLDWVWEPALSVLDPNAQNTEVTINASDQFIVTATSDIGCSNSDTVNVQIIIESPSLGDDLDLCTGESAVLSSGFDPDYTFTWSTDETTPEIEVDESGVYSVIIESPEGCEDTAEVEVTVHDLPVVDLGEDQSLCEGDDYDINAGNPGSDFLWSTEEVSQSINVTETAVYSVAVTDGFGCVGEDEVLVEFHLNPIINLPDTITICEDEPAELDAENSGSTYLWSTGDTTQTILVDVPDTYEVLVTNVHDCSSSDETLLEVAYYPSVNLGEDQAACVGDSIILDSESIGLNVNWSTGTQGQSIVVYSSGSYSVTVDNDYCFTSDLINVVFNPNPTLIEPVDTVICFDEPPHSYTIDAGNVGALYNWSTSQTSQSITVDDYGIYQVQITSPFGCSSISTVNVIDGCFGNQLYVPNSFTPNNDGINEFFFAYGDKIVQFEMQIWNRWGEKIWSCNDINVPWDGSVNNGGYYVEPDTYIWIVKYTYIEDEFFTESSMIELQGAVTLVR